MLISILGTLVVTPANTPAKGPWSVTLPVPAGVITSLEVRPNGGLDTYWETTKGVLKLHCDSLGPLVVSWNTQPEVKLSETSDSLYLNPVPDGQKPTVSEDDLVQLLRATMDTLPSNGLGCMLSYHTILSSGGAYKGVLSNP